LVRETGIYTPTVRMTVGFYEGKRFVNVPTVYCDKHHSNVDLIANNTHHP